MSNSDCVNQLLSFYQRIDILVFYLPVTSIIILAGESSTRTEKFMAYQHQTETFVLFSNLTTVLRGFF